MLKLKTKWFSKWAKQNFISDERLINTINDLSHNIGTAALGADLYKVRIPAPGRGKSGGFRIIVVYKKADIAIFVYGFSKGEKENLDKEELQYLKKLSKDLLSIDRSEYNHLEKSDDFISIKE